MHLKLFSRAFRALGSKQGRSQPRKRNASKQALAVRGTEVAQRVLALTNASPPEVEAPKKLQPCFREDPSHGMINFEFDPSESSSMIEDDMDRTFLLFYEKKIREVQLKEGDKDHLPISGNIYMYWAIAGFGDSSGLFQQKADNLLVCGLVVTMVVQIIAPICLLWWALHNIQFDFSTWAYFTKFSSFIEDRSLGLMFIILFTLNGLYTLRSDKNETVKMVHMCKIFEKAAEKYPQYEAPCELWLWIGAFVNCLVLIICSICLPLCFFLGENDVMGPKDIVFDAFALTFLYNLDDPVGELSFLDEKWDEDMMGDVYGLLADNNPIMEEIKDQRDGVFTADNIYDIGITVQWVLVFVLPLAYMFVSWSPRVD